MELTGQIFTKLGKQDITVKIEDQTQKAAQKTIEIIDNTDGIKFEPEILQMELTGHVFNHLAKQDITPEIEDQTQKAADKTIELIDNTDGLKIETEIIQMELTGQAFGHLVEVKDLTPEIENQTAKTTQLTLDLLKQTQNLDQLPEITQQTIIQHTYEEISKLVAQTAPEDLGRIKVQFPWNLQEAIDKLNNESYKTFSQINPQKAQQIADEVLIAFEHGAPPQLPTQITIEAPEAPTTILPDITNLLTNLGYDPIIDLKVPFKIPEPATLQGYKTGNLGTLQGPDNAQIFSQIAQLLKTKFHTDPKLIDEIILDLPTPIKPDTRFKKQPAPPTELTDPLPQSAPLPNDPPQITSTPTFTLNENNTAVGNITAIDPENQPLTFNITNGPDGALFNIDPNTGTLTFLNPPDFENPQDTGNDNNYQLTLQVQDNLGAIDQQTININILPTNDNAPQLNNLGNIGIVNNGDPILIDPDATVTDLDLDFANHYNSANLKVQREGGANANDNLSFNLAAFPSLTDIGTAIQTTGGATLATYDPTNAANGALTIHFQTATPNQVDNILQAIQINNASTAVNNALITYQYTFNDGEPTPATLTATNTAQILYLQLTSNIPVNAAVASAGQKVMNGVNQVFPGTAGNNFATMNIIPTVTNTPTNTDTFDLMITNQFVMNGQAGNDVLNMNIGTPDNPIETMQNNQAIINGEANNDILAMQVFAGLLNQNQLVLDGGTGTDILILNAQAQTITSNPDIQLNGAAGNDTISLDLQAQIIANNPNIQLRGGAGNDEINLDVKAVAFGNNLFQIAGGPDNNTIEIDIDAQTVVDNNFIIEGGTGADTVNLNVKAIAFSNNTFAIVNGQGTDTVSISGIPTGQEAVILVFDHTNELGDAINGLTLTNGMLNFAFNNANFQGFNPTMTTQLQGTLAANPFWTFTATNNKLFYDTNGAAAGGTLTVADFTNATINITTADLTFFT